MVNAIKGVLFIGNISAVICGLGFICAAIAIRLKRDHLLESMRQHDCRAWLRPRSRLLVLIHGHTDALSTYDFENELKRYESSSDPADREIREKIESFRYWSRLAKRLWAVPMGVILMYAVLFILVETFR